MPHAAAWAEMLATASKSHARLSRVVERHTAAVYRSKLIEGLENERAKLARELHSGAGQPLSAIKLHTSVVEGWSEDMPIEIRQACRRLGVLADSALEQIRSVSHRLHPSAWMDRSPGDVLNDLVDDLGISRQQWKVESHIEPIGPDLPWASKAALYRCAQECISNAIRHSGGSVLRLEVRPDNGYVRMSISDNGKGIEPRTAGRGGIGLLSVREFASAAGGWCRVSATGPHARDGRGRGTTIVIGVPITE